MNSVATRWLLSLGLILGLAPLVLSSPKSKTRIAIFHGPQESYRDAAVALKDSLAAGDGDCVLVELPAELDQGQRDSALKALREAKPDLVATGGVDATTLALQELENVPVVFFMVPNARDAFPESGAATLKRLCGVTSDIAPTDWIEWIREVQPECRQLALLFSGRSQRTADEILKAGQARGISVRLIKADSGDFPSAINDLSAAKCDSALMIPDARVYNGPNIQRLLLWGVRTKTPIWTFSSKIVKAGALGAQYVSSREVGRQAADLVRRIRAGTGAPAIGIQYPTTISRAVNERTANLIGLKLSDYTLARVNERLGGEP